MLTCRWLEDRLEQYIDGTLSAEDRATAAAHVTSCPRCRDLTALAGGELDLTLQPPGGDDALTASILRSTSGDACDTALSRLCDQLDATIDAAGDELVGMHVQHCAGCREMARALTMLSETLPQMAEIRPDPDFVADVMRATARPATGLAGLLGSLRERVAALLVRPRFPMEAAYAGMIAIWLLAGTSISPLRGMPERALELARLNPIQMVEDVVEPASVGRKVWDSTGEPVLARARAVEPLWKTRLRDAVSASRSFGADFVGMFGAALSGDLDSGATYLKRMGTDIKSIWKGLTRPANEAGAPAQEA